jgi:hypothetical protein
VIYRERTGNFLEVRPLAGRVFADIRAMTVACAENDNVRSRELPKLTIGNAAVEIRELPERKNC